MTAALEHRRGSKLGPELPAIPGNLCLFITMPTFLLASSRIFVEVHRSRLEAITQEVLDSGQICLIGINVRPGYVAFIRGALIDNYTGFLKVREGHPPPSFRERFFVGELVGLSPLGGDWYSFGTT